MEKAYAFALIIYIFFHQTNLFYNPIEATKESTVFIYLTLMAFKKINSQRLDYNSYCGDVRKKIVQFLTLCLTVQVLLVIAWFPLSIIVHYLVNMVWHHGSEERDGLVKLIQDNSASFILLALELFALLMGFEMTDIQRSFCSREDILLSKSVISIVKKKYERVLRRQKRNQRKRSRK